MEYSVGTYYWLIGKILYLEVVQKGNYSLLAEFHANSRNELYCEKLKCWALLPLLVTQSPVVFDNFLNVY